jgi:uncharacterized protein (TIRG00374 family)
VRRRLLQTAAGLAVSAVAVWLTFRGKDLGQIWTAMREADYRYLAVFGVCWGGIHLARTARWGLLLEPVARVPFARLNAASAVGWMALIILPFRLGEFARPYLVAERPTLRVSAALSSVVVERVADGIFTALLLAACLFAVPSGSPGVALLRTAGAIVSAAFIGALAFLVVAYHSRAATTRVLERLVAPLSPRTAAHLSSTMGAFMEGLQLVPTPRKIGRFILLTIVYWGLNGWSMAILARGFGLSLDLLQATTLLGAVVIGVMIPAGPGNVGTFQGAVLLGLRLYFPPAVVARQGIAYANVMWLSQVVLQGGLGLVFLFSRHIKLGQVLAASAEVSHELEEEAHPTPQIGGAARDGQGRESQRS